MTNSIVKPPVKTTMVCVLLFIAGSINIIAQTDTWVQKSDFRYDQINITEVSVRSGVAGFSIGSKGYLGTGTYYDGDKRVSYYLKNFWEFDPSTKIWNQKADFAGGKRDRAIGFSIGSKGYLGTGYDGTAYKKDFWEFDPVANTWTQKTDFGGSTRSNAVGFSIDNKGYLGTGVINDGTTHRLNDFWEYDPDGDTWVQKADLTGIGRSSAVGFNIGSK